jgi:membrane protein YdbS with pleckstrin-like domain
MGNRLAERLAPLSAVAAVVAAFACCVPLGLAGAVGVLSIGLLFDAWQGWFLFGAVALFVLAAVLSLRARRACRRTPSRISLTILGLSAAVVVLVLVFPQIVAGWIADYVL